MRGLQNGTEWYGDSYITHWLSLTVPEGKKAKGDKMTGKEYLTDIGQQIQKVYNPDLIDLLIYRYIKGMTQEQAAETMNVSWRNFQRMERQALEIFESENMQNTQKS